MYQRASGFFHEDSIKSKSPATQTNNNDIRRINSLHLNLPLRPPNNRMLTSITVDTSHLSVVNGTIPLGLLFTHPITQSPGDCCDSLTLPSGVKPRFCTGQLLLSYSGTSLHGLKHIAPCRARPTVIRSARLTVHMCCGTHVQVEYLEELAKARKCSRHKGKVHCHFCHQHGVGDCERRVGGVVSCRALLQEYETHNYGNRCT